MIQGVIMGLRMDGTVPFQELVDFRASCLRALPASHLNKTPLNDIFSAYVSAYQNPTIWNECFRGVIGVISVQIVRDVDAYVKSRPFAVDAFMKIFVK